MESRWFLVRFSTRERADVISVVLADDYELIREGVRLILEREDDIRVVAQAGDADEACRLCAALEPDALLLDINMPGASGWRRSLAFVKRLARPRS